MNHTVGVTDVQLAPAGLGSPRLFLDVEHPELVVRVLEGPLADYEQVRRFRQLVDRAQDCGLRVPAHRYVVKLDPPSMQVPTERVVGWSLEQAVRGQHVHESDLTDLVMALLCLGREVFRSGGDALVDVSLRQFMYGETATDGTAIYFVDLDPVYVTWDRDVTDPARGAIYGRLVADAADLILELEAAAGTSLDACRMAALAVCSEMEDEDPDQPWTALLRDAIIENRPSGWRTWQ
jgi:hypothetical protein